MHATIVNINFSQEVIWRCTRIMCICQLVGSIASSLADCSLSPVTVDVVAAYHPSHCMPYTAYSCLQRPSLWQILPLLCSLLLAQLRAYVRCDRWGDKGRARAFPASSNLGRRCHELEKNSPAHIILGKNCLTSIKCAAIYYYVSPLLDTRGQRVVVTLDKFELNLFTWSEGHWSHSN